jgi:hypothetical protein
VTVDEWSAFRAKSDIYFGMYRELATLIWVEYVAKLVREYPKRLIVQEFAPELQPLTDLGQQMMSFRARIERLRAGKCVGTYDGKQVVYGYFDMAPNRDRGLEGRSS